MREGIQVQFKNRNEEKKRERVSVINKANKETDSYLYFFKCCSGL